MARELDSVAEALRDGRVVEPVTVRAFLNWFDAQRRGVHVVRHIREEMERAGIQTVPDFESLWIEAPIQFRAIGPTPEEPFGDDSPKATAAEPSANASSTSADTDGAAWVSRDPTYKISKLAAANAGVTRVAPTEQISRAVTLMLSRDFSQLPVMTTERELKGIVSWRSIGSRMSLGKGPERVCDAMEQAYELPADASIFEAITLIVRHEHILVRADTRVITGIITASDLSLQFRTLTEPFLVLSEIENLVRNMIGSKFALAELAQARDPSATERPVSNVSDLTFGEYVRLLENPDRWGRLALRIDRDLFCKNLDRVRAIRNDVMHFDPDGITPEDLVELQTFAQFLKRLEMLRG